MAGWIKIPVGMEVGLTPGHSVLDTNPSSLPKRGYSSLLFGPCLLWPNGWMDQDATYYDGRARPGLHCVRCGPSSTPRGTVPKFSTHVCCGQTGGWNMMPLGTRVGLGPGHVVLHGDPAPPPKGAQLLLNTCIWIKLHSVRESNRNSQSKAHQTVLSHQRHRHYFSCVA